MCDPMMRRSALLLTATLAVAALSAPVFADAAVPLEVPKKGATALAPGISYQRLERAEGTVHVVRIRPGPRRSVSPILTTGRPTTRATLTTAMRARSGLGSVAGLNGDFFNFNSSKPSGLVLLNGLLINEPEPTRTAALLSGGGLLAERLTLEGTWQADGALEARAIDGLNRPAETGRETVVYTPTFGETTPTGPSRYEVRVALDPPAVGLPPNVPVAGTVLERRTGGGIDLQVGQVVLTAIGADGPNAANELPVGARVTLSPTVAGIPPGVLNGIGGGPILVRDGGTIESAGEGFTAAQVFSRTSRTAIGQQANGFLMFVMVEGPLTGRRGVTVAEQARLMRDLGAVTAVAMDAGGSAGLALHERLAAPREGERAITDALVASYSGVHIPEILNSRMTPNGDRVADQIRTSVRVPVKGILTVTLAHRKGRNIRITRRLAGPTARAINLNAKRLKLGDGIYTLRARLEPVGEGAASSHSRRILVDRTLAALTLRPLVRRIAGKPRPKLNIRFRLFRQSQVTVTIRDENGKRLRTITRGKKFAAGTRTVIWDRTVRRSPARGTFLIDVEVRSQLGRTGLRERITLTDPRGRPPADPEPTP